MFIRVPHAVNIYILLLDDFLIGVGSRPLIVCCLPMTLPNYQLGDSNEDLEIHLVSLPQALGGGGNGLKIIRASSGVRRGGRLGPS